MNWKVILTLLGRLWLALAVALILYRFSLWIEGIPLHLPSFLFYLSLMLLFVGAATMLWHGSRDLSILNTKDAVISVVFTWASLIFFGALPYVFYGLSIADAIFESASGFSTTGASIFHDVESLPHTLLLWRSFSQWLGGMGIIVFFVAVFPAIGAAGRVLFRSEMPGTSKESFTPHIKDTTQHLWGIYLVLTMLLIIILKVFGMSFFDAVNHAFCTISTAGFSTHNDSIGAFSPSIQWITIVFMLAGGINFQLYVLLFKPIRAEIFKDVELRWYLSFIFLAGSLISIVLFLQTDHPSLEVLRYGIFTVVSLITTTGFTNIDYETFPIIAQALLLILFFTGGSASSTSGGLKFSRLALFFLALSNEVKKSISPNLVSSVKMGTTRFSDEIINRVFIFICVYFFSVGLMCVLLLLDGVDFYTAFTAAASVTGNIGIAFGDVGPSKSFASLSDYSKYVSSFFMVLGRLEFFTLLAFLHPSFWHST